MKKLKIVLVVSIALNLVIGYLFYHNWQTRNLLYMHDYMRLTGATSLLKSTLDFYLEKGSAADLKMASMYCQSAESSASAFHNYFQDDTGYRLTTELAVFYHDIQFNISKEDNEKLENSVKQLDRLIKVLEFQGIEESKWRLKSGFHYSRFPSHPAGHQHAKRLLKLVSEMNGKRV